MIWDHEAALDIPPVGSQVLVLMGAPPSGTMKGGALSPRRWDRN